MTLPTVADLAALLRRYQESYAQDESGCSAGLCRYPNLPGLVVQPPLPHYELSHPWSGHVPDVVGDEHLPGPQPCARCQSCPDCGGTREIPTPFDAEAAATRLLEAVRKAGWE